MPSYEKNKSSGLWSVRFRETCAEDGNTINKRLSGFKTKKEAQYGYEDYIKERERTLAAITAPTPSPDSMLFDELLEHYLKFTQKRVKESSYLDIRAKINNSLLPYFTGKKMSEITAKSISDWIEGLDRSYSSKKWIFCTLASIYKYGVKYFEVTNTILKVDRPRNVEQPKEMQVWTPEEFKHFAEHVTNPVYHLYFTFLYVTGCRRGEGLAITWNDIMISSKKNATVKISKSITNKTTSGTYAVTTPKNKGSIRTIAVPPMLLTQLLAHKEAQREEYADAWTPELFVFGGTRPLPTSTTDHTFKAAIKKAGVKEIRIHDLRHSCASLLISKGVSIVAVSRQLGHTNIEQTLNTYSHVMPDDTDLIRKALSTIF
ncbi:MAG: site-specific integrase [Clostridia bacterium]|nr:site-specific integrase [Clostridia bacterium]